MKDTLLVNVVGQIVDYQTLGFAAASLTAPAIAAQSAKLNRRVATTTKTLRYLRWLVPAGAALAFELLRDTDLTPIPDLALAPTPALVAASVGLGVVVVAAMMLMAFLEDVIVEFWLNPRGRELLAPIAGSQHCEEALKYLENGGPLVTQWRDQAIAERGQLYVFDCEIMSTLHDAHVAEQTQTASRAASQAAEVERRERLDAVCRKVHGIDVAG